MKRDPCWAIESLGLAANELLPLSRAKVTVGTLRLASAQNDGLDLQFGPFPADFRGARLPVEGHSLQIQGYGRTFFQGRVGKVRRRVEGGVGRASVSVDAPMASLATVPFVFSGSALTSVHHTANAARVHVGSTGSAQSQTWADIVSLIDSLPGVTWAGLTSASTGLSSTNEIFMRWTENQSAAGAILDWHGSEPADLLWWDYSTAYGAIKPTITRGTGWTAVDLSGLAGRGQAAFHPRTDLVSSQHATFYEKYTGEEKGDTFAAGGSGTAATRPGTADPHTYSKSAGDSNWFTWASGGSGGRELRFRYPATSAEAAAAYATGQTAWSVGVFGTTAAIQALLARKYWTPWEGSVSFLQDAPGSIDFGGKRIVITNGPAEWADMIAPVSAHTIDLITGRETVTTGPPYGYTMSTALWDSADRLRW
jgi:hypothetical protein